jgi:hypothetical protein
MFKEFHYSWIWLWRKVLKVWGCAIYNSKSTRFFDDSTLPNEICYQCADYSDCLVPHVHLNQLSFQYSWFLPAQVHNPHTFWRAFVCLATRTVTWSPFHNLTGSIFKQRLTPHGRKDVGRCKVRRYDHCCILEWVLFDYFFITEK